MFLGFFLLMSIFWEKKQLLGNLSTIAYGSEINLISWWGKGWKVAYVIKVLVQSGLDNVQRFAATIIDYKHHSLCF